MAKRCDMCLANRGEIELVLGIMWLHEIVCNFVCKSEEPAERELRSDGSKNIRGVAYHEMYAADKLFACTSESSIEKWE